MNFLALFLCFCGYMLISSASWIVRKFGEVTYEQIIFHINVPLDSETKLIISYFQNTVMMAIILVIIIYLCQRRFKSSKYIYGAATFFIISIIYFGWRMNVPEMWKYKQRRQIVSNFYEQNYVNPNDVEITAPEHKKNLIFIFAESMEATYAGNNLWQDNLIPNLSKLAQENVNFGDGDEVKGFFEIIGADYTQASVVSQMCAVPLKIPLANERFFRPKNGFLPKATCLFDILQKEGYNQSFLIGTVREYAGTDKLLSSHGNVKLLDCKYFAVQDNLDAHADKKRTKVVRDNRLFEYAKEELSKLSSENKPFFLTLMTLDTHFANEYFEKDKCPILYHDDKVKDEDYFKNVISCADYQLGSFINWLKTQNFYNNTLIVIVGDHLAMNDALFEKISKRKVFDVYINGLNRDINETRLFSALDTMPTVLEGLGYKINGHRLGLGTSLYSDEKTLLEKGFTAEKVGKELDKSSAIYNYLLFGK